MCMCIYIYIRIVTMTIRLLDKGSWTKTTLESPIINTDPKE